MEHLQSFRAMDTDIDLVIESDQAPLDALLSLRLLFEQQEERFSRFRPTSLLSALNRGETVADARFAACCRLALEAHAFTAGLYNPMILPALRQAGYATTFASVSGGDPQPTAVPDPGDCLSIAGDEVRLATGALDLGGIVKGWTVDLGIGLIAPRYPDSFLNAGGDIRCNGNEAGGSGWRIAVDGLTDDLPAWEGALCGAVATSSIRKRRWSTPAGKVAHHLIDPRTGLPAESPFVQVTAWAPETWRAETWAKAVLIGGEPAAKAAVTSCERVVTLTSEGDVRTW